MILKTLIKANEKYAELRLRKTVFNRLHDSVEYIFSFPRPLTEAERSEIETTVRFLTPDGLNIYCKYVLDDYGAAAVKNEADALIKKLCPMANFRDGLSVAARSAGENAVEVKIAADEFASEVMETGKVYDALREHFQTVTAKEVILSVEPYEKPIDVDKLIDKIETRQQLAVELQMAKPRRYFETTEHYKLIGKEIATAPRYIADLTVPSKSCTVCGRAAGLRSFPTKNPDLYVCKMELNDTTDKIQVVLFAKNDAYKKYMLIAEGDELIVSGSADINSYSGKKEVKAYNVSKCKIKFAAPEAPVKAAPAQYITVKPKPYYDETQVSLFEKNTVTSEFLLKNDVVVFDFETTGLEPRQDKIIEIGAVKIKKGKIAEVFTSFIDPEISFSPKITEITGITGEMVAGKPVFGEVVGDFFKFSRDAVLVAHNIDFDFSFLEKNAPPFGYVFDNARFDTIALARSLFTGGEYKGAKSSNYKLQSVATALGVEFDVLHRALDDAVLTAKVLIKMLEYDPDLL